MRLNAATEAAVARQRRLDDQEARIDQKISQLDTLIKEFRDTMAEAVDLRAETKSALEARARLSDLEGRASRALAEGERLTELWSDVAAAKVPLEEIARLVDASVSRAMGRHAELVRDRMGWGGGYSASSPYGGGSPGTHYPYGGYR